jgi:hypothetical protein
MNYQKISISLALAFQISEGPFDIVIIKVDGSSHCVKLGKELILELVDEPEVLEIRPSWRIMMRRWRPRLNSKDRRNTKISKGY